MADVCAACMMRPHRECLRPSSCQCTVCKVVKAPKPPPVRSDTAAYDSDQPPTKAQLRHAEAEARPPKGPGRDHRGQTSDAEAEEIQAMVVQLLARIFHLTNTPPEVLLK